MKKKSPKSKATSAKKKTPAKKKTATTTEIPEGPLWKKLEDFVYELIDPVTGGRYRCVAKRDMEQVELFQKWEYVYVLCRRARPQSWETHFLVLPS